jgi:hypothetical protein
MHACHQSDAKLADLERFSVVLVPLRHLILLWLVDWLYWWSLTERSPQVKQIWSQG